MQPPTEARHVPLTQALASSMQGGDQTYTCVTCGPEATMQVAAELAQLVVPGELVLLSGELGAGKTQFARGFCSGLGLRELYEVDSPTYTIINHYEVASGVDHLDLYRLGSAEDLEEVALDSLLASSTIKLIEWPERLVADPLPPGYLVRFLILDEERRQLMISRLPGSNLR